MKTILIAAALLSGTALAHHPLEPEMVIPGPLPMCDTEEQFAPVWKTLVEVGAYEGGAALKDAAEGHPINRHGEPVCGFGGGMLMVVRTIDSGWVKVGGAHYWAHYVQMVDVTSGRQAFGAVQDPGGEKRSST